MTRCTTSRGLSCRTFKFWILWWGDCTPPIDDNVDAWCLWGLLMHELAMFTPEIIFLQYQFLKGRNKQFFSILYSRFYCNGSAMLIWIQQVLKPYGTVDSLVKQFLGGGFKYVFIFTPTWGRFPIWLIFFKWVETTNQIFFRQKKTAHGRGSDLWPSLQSWICNCILAETGNWRSLPGKTQMPSFSSKWPGLIPQMDVT